MGPGPFTYDEEIDQHQLNTDNKVNRSHHTPNRANPQGMRLQNLMSNKQKSRQEKSEEKSYETPTGVNRQSRKSKNASGNVKKK